MIIQQLCNDISFFVDWYTVTGLFVKLAVSCLLRHSDFEPAVLLLRHLSKYMIILNCYVTLKNLEFSRTWLGIEIAHDLSV